MASTDSEDSLPADAYLDAGRVISGDLGLPISAAPKARARRVEAWLRWGLSNGPKARKNWAILAQTKGYDRDRWVLALWRSIADPGGPNHFAKQELEKCVPQKCVPWSFYQQHLFGWFLGRFDVQAARSVFVGWRMAACLHAFLVTVLVTVPWLSLGLWTLDLTSSLKVFLGLLALMGGVGLFSSRIGLPRHAYFNSLSPRLAAAVGIGYLFFFSAPHLIKIINDTQRPPWQLWFGVGLLIVAALSYLSFHISRRVHPQLKPGNLFLRSGSILVLALAYSSLGLLIAGPMLFSRPFLCTDVSAAVDGATACSIHADVHRLAFCAAVALNLGVILQLAWDEKPLTEPL